MPKPGRGGHRKPLTFDERLRQEILLQLRLPCPTCTMTPTLVSIAAVCGIRTNTLWRFTRMRNATMLRKHLLKVVEWLRERGVKIEDPPSPETPAGV